MLRVTLTAALLVLLVTPAAADNWQMKQRDMWNTGRADFSPMPDDTIFDTFLWQTPSQGVFKAISMSFFDGAGPGGTDIVTGLTSGWSELDGIQAFDRHTGAPLWSGPIPDVDPSIYNSTVGFSNDGSVLYVMDRGWDVGHVYGMYSALGPAGGIWDNSGDPDSRHLCRASPTIGPGGRIFGHPFKDRPYAGTDDPGVAITETWGAADNWTGPIYSDPALYLDGGTLKVIAAGSGSWIVCYDGNVNPGTQLWAVSVAIGTNSSPTIDPANGNIYVALVPDAGGSIYVAGVTKDGADLWDQTSKLVYEFIDGTTSRQYLPAPGCLSHDSSTFYFQSGGWDQYDGKLYAINTADGTVKWSFDTAAYGGDYNFYMSAPIVTPNGVIIVGDNFDTYYAILDGGQGNPALLDTIASGGRSLACASATMDSDGKMYLPLYTKHLGGLGGDGTDKLLFACFQLSAATIPGDVDGNGVVDGLDLTAVLSAWETTPGNPLWNENADLDDNNVVDGLDLTEVISNWTTAAAAAPSTGPEATILGSGDPDKPGARRANVHKGRGNGPKSSGNVRRK